MSAFYKSDKSGIILAPDDHKIGNFRISVDANHIDPIAFQKRWDLTKDEYKALAPAWDLMFATIEQAVQDFIAAVEN